MRWFLVNSEDVGDIGAMLSLAMSVGFGITGIMLYMFTTEALRQYAVLKAMGATSRLLLAMIFVQAGLCALPGHRVGARPMRHHWPDRRGGRIPIPHDVVHAADRGRDGRASERRSCRDQRSPRTEA